MYLVFNLHSNIFILIRYQELELQILESDLHSNIFILIPLPTDNTDDPTSSFTF